MEKDANSTDESDDAAQAAAEEILRVIYGDDLNGCTVSLDRIADIVRGPVEAHASQDGMVMELHQKGFEAIQLLSSPPPNGHTLAPEDLRSLLSERLDKIQSLTTKIIAATNS